MNCDFKHFSIVKRLIILFKYVAYPRVNCHKSIHVVFSLDIVILLFGISRVCFCHIHTVLLISNLCYIFAVIFAVFILGFYTFGRQVASNLKGKVM